MSYSGRYIAKKPKKYRGDPQNIIYSSLWESKFIDSFKKEFGRLPRYNEQAGATIHLLNYKD